MAISITKRFACSRSTSTSSPKATKETTKADDMSMHQNKNEKINKNIAITITKTLACSRPTSSSSPKVADQETAKSGTMSTIQTTKNNKNMAMSITKTFACSRPTSTSSPKATKETTKSAGTMSMNNKRIVTSRGVFCTARKKLMRSKLPRKDIIIIHNNTSITSNEEDIRASCVEVNDITAVKEGKETSLVPPPSNEEKSIKYMVPLASVDATDEAVPAITVNTWNNNEVIGVEIVTDKTDSADVESDHRNDEANDQKKAELEAAQIQLEAAQSQLEAARKELEAATTEKASIIIQAAFRGHLSRRAFGALKSLIKLQAVVRGGRVRRQLRMALHCMYAMVRLRVRVRARQVLNNKPISE